MRSVMSAGAVSAAFHIAVSRFDYFDSPASDLLLKKKAREPLLYGRQSCKNKPMTPALVQANRRGVRCLRSEEKVQSCCTVDSAWPRS